MKIPANQKIAVCQKLVDSMPGSDVDHFCSFTLGPEGDGGGDKEECERAFGFLWGKSACPAGRDGQMVKCRELASVVTAVRSSDVRQCHGDEMCLAALNPTANSCAASERKAVAAYCQDPKIPMDIKNIAVENAFRRRYGFAPYSKGQGLMARSVLIPENKMRRSLGLPAFRMGDPLVSSMLEADRKNYLRSLSRAKFHP